MRQYRLIYDKPTNGKYNMAIDEAIMVTVAAGESLPTLRFYDWDPPCLSLGYNQTCSDVDTENIAALGWDVVRRPTGGKAILHTDELTYSLTVPLDHPLAKGSVVESYRQISRGFMDALLKLGMNPHSDQQQSASKLAGPVCFEVPSHYEITTSDGRKLIGSAQLRRKGVLLQHGSLPLHGDVTRICDVLIYPDDQIRQAAKIRVDERAATLATALGKIVTWREATDAVMQGFIETFDCQFEEAPLSVREIEHAEELVADKYGNDEWTFRS